MGNAGSNQPVSHHHSGAVSREHRHNKDIPPPSPGKEGQAIIFDKRHPIRQSYEEEESYFAKVILRNVN